MRRGEFLFLTAGGSATAMISLTGCENELATDKNPAKRPNIIFIMADYLGYGDLGSYGRKETKTPPKYKNHKFPKIACL